MFISLPCLCVSQSGNAVPTGDFNFDADTCERAVSHTMLTEYRFVKRAPGQYESMVQLYLVDSVNYLKRFPDGSS